jgi:hypothetical protein
MAGIGIGIGMTGMVGMAGIFDMTGAMWGAPPLGIMGMSGPG